jgi:hypothetical protein
MVLGYLIIGMLLGTTAATISLFLGSSVLLALAVYSGVGGICIMLLVAFRYAQQTLIEKKPTKHNLIERRWQSH